MTTNIELLNKARIKGLKNLSIVCKDELTQIKLRPNLCVIINLADSNDESGGTHWTALFISPEMKPFYMDSFGVEMPQEVNTFLNPLRSKIGYSQIKIQNLHSVLCGLFSLTFLIYMTRKHRPQDSYFETFKQFLMEFNDNTKNNDKILMNLYKSL